MAGELVGKAFLSGAVSLLLNKMASPEVWNFFRGRKLDQLLKKLKIKMITINKVLDDAEDKQHTDTIVKQWHDELKDAVYKAEDLLDEIEVESQTTLDKVLDFAASLNPFKTEKLEDILETLQHLIDQINALGLKDGIEKTSYQRSAKNSIPDEPVIYGRDADKEAIMKWMLSDDANNSNPDVLAIVGLGGLGKTTLAQHVYGDSRTDDWFDKKSWVSVSEEFDVPKLTEAILKEFTKQSSNTKILDQPEIQSQDVLAGKRFFLVLDAVWNKDYLMWQDLLKSLRSGTKGSKILVTTRDVNVAKNMQTSPPYQLEKLNEDECWLLFAKHAFNGTGSSSAHPELERIGRRLIENCDGLPLAAKVLGGALRQERDPKKWRKILESETWNLCKNRIFAILKMSYRSLPSHLKRCFAYCAVFPKDYEFNKEQLIRLWMVEGLLTQPKVNIHIEEVENAGEVCFDDLVSRSFFQQSMKRGCFVMHDLINDLAKSISGEFCFRIGVDRSCDISERIRHLWVEKKPEDEVHNQIFTIQHLRTFLYTRQLRWLDNIHEEEMQIFLSMFTHLRVLSLCYYEKIGLPDSIGNLIHLRYLNLFYSSIERLPDSVVKLSNLEILILYKCKQLVELPAEMFKLTNLCLLDIRGTKVRKMPPGMGKLKRLKELAYFIVGKESDCSSIKELGELNRMRGRLCIDGLRNVSKVEESAEANLKCKDKLNELELRWGEEDREDSLHERNVLEKLQPHTNIEQLEIDGYAGMRFPDWVGDSSFSNMVELKLIRCRYCRSLPPLGQLGSLERLLIAGLDGIKVVGPEFYGNGNKSAFGRLEFLKFESMAQWEEWAFHTNNVNEDGGDSLTTCFRLLKCLEIRGCPNLKKIQPARLPSLTRLEIKRCDRLASLPRAPKIQRFWICDGSREMTLQLPPFSPILDVSDWHSSTVLPLEILEQMLESPNSIGLPKLFVKNCDSLTAFPLDLFPVLQLLRFWRCPKLKWLSGCIPSLMKLDIYNCPSVAVNVDWHKLFPNLTELSLGGDDEGSWYEEVESFPPVNMLLPSTLTSLEIRRFPNLKSLDNEGLQSLTSLRNLEIYWCPYVQELWLPPTLTSLALTRLENLTSLDNWGLQRLTSLTQLRIINGPKLQSLPEEVLPSSLQLIDIVECPLLELGEDWPFNPPRQWF